MDNINIGCYYCTWRTECLRKYKSRTLGGHMRWCPEYRHTLSSKKKRALSPSVEVVVDNFTIRQAEADIVEDELEDVWYDLDWEQENHALKDRYDIMFGVDQITMQPNMDPYMFQLNILSLTSKDSDVAPIQTGWIRDRSTSKTTHATWEDYVMINRYITKNNMSVSCGDELLALIQELCRRHSIELNLPRTMRSIK